MLSTRMQIRPFTSVRLAASRTNLLVVAVKPTKAADFRSLSDKEIAEKVGSLKQELASTRFLQRTRGISELKKGEQQNPDTANTPRPHVTKHLKTQVAQLLTVLRERQIKDGVSRKEAKQIEKRALLNAGVGSY